MVTGWPNLSNPVDDVFFFILLTAIVLLIGITGTMIFFVVKYRRRKNPRPEDIEGNLLLEIVWTIVPTLIVTAMFYAGWKGFLYMRTVPKDAMHVKVTARMWSWTFDYENGKRSDILRVPLERPVKLSITSLDVIHSLYIPTFRVKEDAVPGIETYLWFRPHKTGAFDLFCAEYCGVGHSSMITKVEVLPQDEFERWYRAEKPTPGTMKTVKKNGRDLASKGKKLFQEKGCSMCHSIDGTIKIGPTLKGLYGRKLTVVTAGQDRDLIADESYIRRSLLEPQEDIAKGFPAIMPSQKGILADDEITAIIEYIKTLK